MSPSSLEIISNFEGWGLALVAYKKLSVVDKVKANNYFQEDESIPTSLIFLLKSISTSKQKDLKKQKKSRLTCLNILASFIFLRILLFHFYSCNSQLLLVAKMHLLVVQMHLLFIQMQLLSALFVVSAKTKQTHIQTIVDKHILSQLCPSEYWPTR